MEKLKNNVLADFKNMIVKSWTYNRMTEKEKKTCIGTLANIQTLNALKGTYKQRWEILQAVYKAYLNGLGYDGCLWRETEPQPF